MDGWNTTFLLGRPWEGLSSEATAMLVSRRVDLFLSEISRIGTSNFRTLVGHQPPEQHGLSIEAMPFYIKDLRRGKGWGGLES